MDKKSAIRAATFAILLITYIVFRPQIEEKMGWAKPVDEKVETTDEGKKNSPVQTITDETVKEFEAIKKEAETLLVEAEKFEKNLTKEETVLFSHANKDIFQAELIPSQGIRSITLNEFNKTQEADSPFLKIASEKHSTLALSGSAATWQFTKPRIISKKTSHGGKRVQKIVVERFAPKQRLKIRQKWQLVNGEKYRYQYSISFINTAVGVNNIKDIRFNCGYMMPISGDQGLAAGMDQAIDAYTVNGEVETENFTSVLDDIKEIEEKQKLAAATGEVQMDIKDPVKWVAVKNQYFATAIDFENGTFEKVYLRYKPLSKTDKEEKNIAYAEASLKDFFLSSGAVKTFRFDCYSGPQEVAELEALPNEKKNMMQLSFFMFTKVSWIGWISEMLLNFIVTLEAQIASIDFIASVGSFGVAIIALTILIKLLFWPLTSYSNKSMKKMSSLGPLTKEISEKYKDDPQARQQKIMAMYRDNGVNPMAGCLPMLLQMPVFLALFNTLRGSIELRHSSFLWASDLTQPDTIATIMGINLNPLAILWAGSMVLNQKIMPSSASADPMQKRMMMFMPLIMLVFCYGMPSGLTLYYTCSTLMTIIQYYLMNRGDSKTAETKA